MQYLIMISLTGLLLTVFQTPVLPNEIPSERTEINLSGEWRFQADRQNDGETAGWFTDDCDTRSWLKVNVPIVFDRCGPDMDRYVGAGWFRRTISVPEAFEGRHIILRFEGLNYNSKIWLNGTLVGENHDAFLPFELPINDTVRIGEENQIAIRIDNIRQRGQFPLFEGWLGQGGFLREAYLMATNTIYIQHTFLVAKPDPQGGYFRLQASVIDESNQPTPVQIQVRILDAKGKELTSLHSSSQSLAPGQENELAVEGFVPEVQPWSPDSPILYTAHVALLRDGKVLDRLTRRIGFRHVQVKDATLFLNGKPIFLRGFNRHEDSPHTGMAVDLDQARADFMAMKALGCNYVRLCHYPHHPGELDLCDELGLLVLAENAMNEWGHVDHPDPNGGFQLTPEDAPLILENAKRTLRKMVQRDNHHPSVILWSISNENAEERTDIAQGNGELIQYGQTLDRSRPWTHVSNSFNKEGWKTLYRYDDVIVVNVYPSHHISLDPANLDAKLPEATQFMENVLSKLHQEFPDKPIVIGEFGYPGGENGKEGAELQAIATEAELKGLSAPYVAGCALWAYARHPWATNAFYAGGNLISPYGYVSRDRQTRFPALSIVERYYKEWTERPFPPAKDKQKK